MIKKIIGLSLSLLIISCATRESPPAPIADGIARFAAITDNTNIAAPIKETKAVPEEKAPTKINKLTVDTDNAPVAPVKQRAEASSANSSKLNVPKTQNAKNGWMMPNDGAIAEKYTAENKGINIKNTPGSAVFAASDGKVVYSGNGLKGYGNLIIIRHDNGYLTAYALNKVNLVKSGMEVKAGDKIATVGDEGILHFELRKNGKPVNPVTYIKGKGNE